MGPEFSVPPAILAVMERWARLQPLAALPCGSGWIWPASTSFCWQNVRPGTAKLCPRLAVESYDLADGSRQLTRDPGDVLWADDCLELTLGAAAALLDVDPREGKAGPPASQELLQCLHCARLLLEDLARTSEELRLFGRPARASLALREDGVEVLEVRDLDGSRERAVRPLLRLGAARSSCAACFGPQDVELAPQLVRPRKFAGDATSPTLRDASAKKNGPQAPARLPGRRRIGGVSATPDHGRRRAVRRKSSWHLVACGAGATLRQDLSIDTVKGLRPPRRREG